MMVHLIRVIAIMAFLVACMLYPYLPGNYDRFSVPLSWMVQVLGAGGLSLVPVGLLWLLHERRKRLRALRNLPYTDLSHPFAMVALAIGTIIALVVALVGLKTAGASVGVSAFLVWIVLLLRMKPALKGLKTRGTDGWNPVPLYLVIIPAAIFLFQLLLAEPATEFSRRHAIAASEPLIREIEDYRAREGHYPASLLAVNQDFYTSMVGIEKFHYSPNGVAYDLYFEQPRFVFDRIGTREFVAFNKHNEHLVPSHAAWVLDWTREQLKESPGWYTAQETKVANWKSFLFD